MLITRYGTDIAIPILVASVLLVVGGFWISTLWVKIGFMTLGSIMFLFTLNFFRDPDRITPEIAGGVVSPADGKVVDISETEEKEYLGGKAMQVCIFMSPLDVHVNRFPISGTIEYFRHIPGKYVMAFEDKSSELNERTLIGIDNGSFKVLFKQIAGFVARRIVCPIRTGDTAVAGERFGMIRFGSRVDVLIPLDAEILVKENQTVLAGETVLAVVGK